MGEIASDGQALLDLARTNTYLEAVEEIVPSPVSSSMDRQPHLRHHTGSRRDSHGTGAASSSIVATPPTRLHVGPGSEKRGRFTCRLVTHNVFGLPAVNCAFHEAPHTVAHGAKLGTQIHSLLCVCV